MACVDLIMTFGSKLRAMRQDRGLSGDDLAKRVGVTKAYIHQVETGRLKSVTAQTLARLADALDVPVSEFADDLPPEVVTLASLIQSAYGVPVAGEVGAGPLRDVPDAETISIPTLLRPADAVYRVAGTSMKEMGILDGDYIAVRLGPTASHQDVVVAYLADQGGHVLRVFWRPNPNLGAELVKPGTRDDAHRLTDDDAILGVYVGLIRTRRPRA